MSDQPVRSHRAIAIAIIIAGVLISASMFVAVSGANKTVTHTTTTTVTQDPSLSTSSSVQNLDLLLALNASQLTAGQTVGVNLTLTNTLPSSQNVTADRVPYNVTLGPCGDLNEPFGLLIAQGFYTVGNASSATPLALYDPGGYFCPAVFVLSSYAFQPDSYMTSACEIGGTCVQLAAIFSGAYSGYWVPDGGSSQDTLTPLKPGVYTVVAAAEWGQVDVLHFTVASASS